MILSSCSQRVVWLWTWTGVAASLLAAGCGQKPSEQTSKAAEYYNRAVGWAEMGEFDRAIADYSEAIRLDSEMVYAYFNRGIVYSRDKNQQDRAIADYTKALELQPKMISAVYNRGVAWEAKGDDDRAIADYSQAIRLDPSMGRAYGQRGVCYFRRCDYDRANVDFDKLIKLEPGNSLAYSSRGDIRRMKGEYDGAIEDYNAALRSTPELAPAYHGLAKTWVLQGAPDQAIAACEEAQRLDPASADVCCTSGDVWRLRGQYAKAVAQYEKASGLNPQWFLPFCKLAWVFAASSDPAFRDGKRAIEHAEKARALAGESARPGDAPAHCVEDVLAAAYAEAGDFEAAVKWQTAAVKLATAKEKAGLQSRLELYQAGKPYREELKNSPPR